MARKAKRKLPKNIRQAIDAKHKQDRAVEAIDPMRSENPVLMAPPEIQKPAQLALPPSLHSSPDSTGLLESGADSEAAPSVPERGDAHSWMKKLSSQVLVGHESDDACTFWIDLKEDILDGIRLQITLKPGHRVVARMFVTSAPTQQFIRERVPRLRKRLQQRGLHLDSLEIIV